MENTILCVTTRYEKKAGTKTVWNKVSENNEMVSENNVNNVVGSCKFFRRLGGSETVTRSYTSEGYVATTNISTSPNKKNRTIRKWIYGKDDIRKYIEQKNIVLQQSGAT